MSTSQVVLKEDFTRQGVIGLLGISHNVAPVGVREKFAVNIQKQPELINRLTYQSKISEAVVINTCNRLEVVISHDEQSSPLVHDQVIRVFEDYSGMSRRHFIKNLYQYSNVEAVNHLFRVTSGLDSMIIGEPQILGQVKQAYEVSRQNGGTKVLLNKLFHRAFSTAKSVRSKTAISQNAVSVCYAARELAKQIFGDFSGLSMMVIGAGETAELALKHFVSAGIKEVYIANRTRENALRIANTESATILDLSAVGTFLQRVDIVIGASTVESHNEFIVSWKMAKAASEARFGKVQFYIDLGIPRNIEPQASEIEEVFLYNIDDLKSVVSENINARMLELKRAEIIIDEAVEKFLAWQEKLKLEPTIRSVYELYNTEKNEEIAKTMRVLRKSGVKEENLNAIHQAISVFGDSLISKILHGPIESARNIIEVEEAEDFIRRCFLKYRK